MRSRASSRGPAAPMPSNDALERSARVPAMGAAAQRGRY